MKLKNETLRRLYDKLAFDTLAFGISEQSQIDKAFIECDLELSEQIKNLQQRSDIFEKFNGVLLDANLDLATKNRKLQKQVMETTETLEKVNADRNDLQRHIDILSASEREALSANKKLEKDLRDAKTQLTELGKIYDELSEKNKKSNARADCLSEEVKWYRKHYKEKSDKIQELKSTLNSMCGDEYIKKLQDSVSKNCYDQGQTDLWVKLQNVNDAKPFELATCFPDVSCMDDILSWDLEDFLDAYKSWQEKKEQERSKYARPWHGDATAEKIKFEPWTCTFEGTMNVEIDRDLLNKICGIDSDD